MRVLQLGKYYYPYMGGIESHLYILCTELQHEVDLDVVVCNSKRENRRDEIEGVGVTRCYELARVASTSICPTMPFEVAKRRYDVLHLHFPHPMGAVSYLLGRQAARHSLVVTYHSDIVRQKRLLRAYRPLMDRVLDQADAILCTSPDYIDGSEALARVRPKCRVIPYGIELERFDATEAVTREAAAIRARFGNRPLVLGVGRLIYYKGFEYAIRAMRNVDAELLLIGRGPLRADLEKVAHESGVGDRVHFIGEMHNHALVPWYHACDVYALPSIARSEAFAIVQLEAMACGKPVVNTAIPHSGVPFVSRDGESGFTVAPLDADAFARALSRLVRDSALARKFGQSGRARVVREFSKETMTRSVLSIYGEVAKMAAIDARHRAQSVAS